MFKTIPGNSKYIISLSQEFRDVNGDPVVLQRTKEGRVIIELYGKKVEVDPAWVSLLSHFEIYLPEPSFEKLYNVNFVQNNIRFFQPNASQLPVFSRPANFKHEGVLYRVVPNYCRYAISARGDLIEVDTKNPIKVCVWRANSKKPETEQYPCVYVYDPDRSGYRYVYIHRLVGMAWVKHPDGHYILKSILNHKDGDKKNYVAGNLEWCTFQDNSLHMYSTGLRTDNIECCVRDFMTGKVYDFPSKSQAATFMGVVKTKLNNEQLYLRKGKLINDQYEFKLKTDDSEWFYAGRTDKIKPGRYLLTVRDKEGGIYHFSDLRDFKKQYAIWNVPNAYEMLKLARTKYPDLEFVLVDQYQSGVVQAYDVKREKVLESRTINEMSKLVGIPKQLIRNCLRDGETLTTSGYAFRHKKDVPWNTAFVRKDKPRNRPLQATNLVTGEVMTFASLRAASRALGVDDRYWLRNCIEQEVQYKGWRFKLLERE